MGSATLVGARTQLADDLEELRSTCTKIRRPSSEDPQFLLTTYGQIMHMRSLQNLAQEHREKKEKKEGSFVKEVRSAFGIRD